MGLFFVLLKEKMHIRCAAQKAENSLLNDPVWIAVIGQHGRADASGKSVGFLSPINLVMQNLDIGRDKPFIVNEMLWNLWKFSSKKKSSLGSKLGSKPLHL